MKMFPPSKFTPLCRSSWERFALWHLESSHKHPGVVWLFAILMTSTLFWIRDPGNPFTLLVALLASLGWVWVLECHLAQATLRVLGRACELSDQRGEGGSETSGAIVNTEPGAPPSGGPAKPSGHPGATEGPPSVS